MGQQIQIWTTMICQFHLHKGYVNHLVQGWPFKHICNLPRQVAAWRPKCTVSRHTVHLAALMLSPTVKRWAVLWCTTLSLSLSLSLWLSFKRRLNSEYSQGTQWGQVGPVRPTVSGTFIASQPQSPCHTRYEISSTKEGFQKNCKMLSKMHKQVNSGDKDAWKRILIWSIPCACAHSLLHLKGIIQSSFTLCVKYCLFAQQNVFHKTFGFRNIYL